MENHKAKTENESWRLWSDQWGELYTNMLGRERK